MTTREKNTYGAIPTHFAINNRADDDGVALLGEDNRGTRDDGDDERGSTAERHKQATTCTCQVHPIDGLTGYSIFLVAANVSSAALCAILLIIVARGVWAIDLAIVPVAYQGATAAASAIVLIYRLSQVCVSRLCTTGELETARIYDIPTALGSLAVSVPFLLWSYDRVVTILTMDGPVVIARDELAKALLYGLTSSVTITLAAAVIALALAARLTHEKRRRHSEMAAVLAEANTIINASLQPSAPPSSPPTEVRTAADLTPPPFKDALRSN